MRKKDEISKPDSCLNKASDDEMIFVLLSRDPAAADTIRFWCKERIRLQKNNRNDAKIVEAMQCSITMYLEGKKHA